MKQNITWNGAVITITYGNGKKFVGDCDTLPESIYVDCAAARHGIGQKLGDAKSGGTADQKYNEVLEIWAALVGGSWNRKGDSGIETIRRAYEIIATGLGKSLDQAATWFQEYADADENRRAEIRAKPHMKSAIATARAEKNLPDDSDENFDPNA